MLLARFTQRYISISAFQNVAGPCFDVLSPFNDKVVGQCADQTAQDVQGVIEKSAIAFDAWKRVPGKERGTILTRYFKKIVENVEELAHIMALESGKPFTEARGEVAYGAGFIQWFAGEAPRCYGRTIPTPSPNRQLLTYKEPVGVSAAVTPFNFPLAMLTRKVGAALASGSTCIAKPSSATPLSALALEQLALEAGVPEGVFTVVTGKSSAELVAPLMASETVRKISFTGSTEVGVSLMKEAADTLKRVSLELGGNAPFIVFEDADIGAAIIGAMLSKYRFAGQTCVCTNRILVHSSIAQEFVTRLTAAVSALKLGDPVLADTQIGPLINDSAVEFVADLVEDAVASGASVVTGGRVVSELGARFYEPTILADVTMDMKIARTEIFGPIAPILTFDSTQEAIDMANDTEYGLAAYAYTKDAKRLFKVASELQFGMVGMNAGILSTEVAPFGGILHSGFGREGGAEGIEEYLQTKYVAIAELD